MRKLLILCIAVIMFNLTGCSNNGEFDKQYQELEEAITLKNGFTQIEVEDTIKTFIRYAYSPESKEDQDKAIEAIKPICNSNGIEYLSGSLNYVEENEEIVDMKICYGSSTNVNDTTNRETAVFTINYDNGDSITYIMVFKLDLEDKIDKYYVVKGV